MKSPALALLAVLCLAAAARAGDLDAPGEKKITVRSEIERGFGAALDLLSPADGPRVYSEKIEQLLAANEQQRTGSDGFRLGVYFEAWDGIWDLLSAGQAVERGDGGRVDVSELAARRAATYFEGFQGLRRRLEISDAQLKELFGVYGYDPARDDAAWAAAVKSGKFKGTKAAGN